MIRSALIALGVAAIVTAITWFVIPASTYVEDALGILMAVFVATVFVTAILLRVPWGGRT
jgi:hypothetical protein